MSMTMVYDGEALSNKAYFNPNKNEGIDRTFMF